MPEYQVTWEIDVDAPDAQAAAVKALAIQRNPEGTATVFDVVPRVGGRAVHIDLTPDAD
jgi:hypothetical protein